jgi:DNA-binding MarR family transcriptional regulator
MRSSRAPCGTAGAHSVRPNAANVRARSLWVLDHPPAPVAGYCVPRSSVVGLSDQAAIIPAADTPLDRLSPPELDAWGGLLRVHTVLYRELERRLVKSSGMPISTYDVLLRLAWAGSSGLRMSELATQLLMTTGGLTRLVDRLEGDGLLTRTRTAHDPRGYEARITPAGRKALRSANQRHLADIRELFLDHVHRGAARGPRRGVAACQGRQCPSRPDRDALRARRTPG